LPPQHCPVPLTIIFRSPGENPAAVTAAVPREPVGGHEDYACRIKTQQCRENLKARFCLIAKGTVSRDFRIQFFVKLYLLVPVNMLRNDSIFSNILRAIRLFWCLTRVIDTGEAGIAGVVDTDENSSPVSLTRVR
jgi:hypothetical protein